MQMSHGNSTVGFIGLGVMGKSMAGHLLKAGYPLIVYNRTKAKALELLEAGAVWADSAAELAAKSHVVITMIGSPKDVEAIYFGTEGIIENARKGTHLIDMTTSSPKLAVYIGHTAKAKGLFALDAPVSGGEGGAREAKLAIMAGGDEAAFNAVLPILRRMGRHIVLQGPCGAGQHTKMCNQIAVAANMMGVCEAMAYAKKSGLDPARVLQTIETGTAGSWILNNLAPRMLAGDYAPGFHIKHFIKDMSIALESAQEMGLETPALKTALKLYEELAGQGEGDSGTLALFKYYCRC